MNPPGSCGGKCNLRTKWRAYFDRECSNVWRAYRLAGASSAAPQGRTVEIPAKKLGQVIAEAKQAIADAAGVPILLRFAIAFALMRARKLVRGLRQGLSEDERYLVADDVVHRLQQHGDPWRLSEEMPEATGKGHSSPPMNERND